MSRLPLHLARATSCYELTHAQYIVAFERRLTITSVNEPDLSTKANMSPVQAAETNMAYMQLYISRTNLRGPAITDVGLTWLTEFYSNCTEYTINFQLVYWYNYTYNTYQF